MRPIVILYATLLSVITSACAIWPAPVVVPATLTQQQTNGTPTPTNRAQSTATLQSTVAISKTAMATTPTLQPNPSPTVLPIGLIEAPLANVIVELGDRCRTSRSLPILSEAANVAELDTTSGLPVGLCEVDCASRQWVADNGSKVTLTLVRFSSESRAQEELRTGWEKSNFDEFVAIIEESGDPYTGIDDDTWWGTLGADGYYASRQTTLYLLIQWRKALQGYDIDWSPHDMENLALLQYGKMYEYLGTPLPRLTTAPVGSWCVP